MGIVGLTTLVLASRAIGSLAMLQAQTPSPRPPVPGAPPGVTAFLNVSVVPMDTEQILKNQTVLIQGGRITALGAASRVPVPAGAVGIDGQGKYLVPGLADCHAHLRMIDFLGSQFLQHSLLGYPSFLFNLLVEYRLSLLMADGITTIRNVDYVDASNEALRIRARAAAGEIWSPRIYTAGRWAPDQYTRAGFDSLSLNLAPKLDSIPAYVAAYKAAGYDFIKIHNEMPDIFVAVLAAARQAGIPVVGHVGEGQLEQVLAGIRSIEHMTHYPIMYGRKSAADSAAYQKLVVDVAAATQRAGVWNCVALSGAYRPGAIRALQDAGAGLLSGSDFIPLHRDLARLVKNERLTPYEALAAATKNFAVYAQTAEETGTIAVGKRADLVLLNGNPLQDIEQVRQPAGVMLGGRWRTRQKLDLAVKAAEQKLLYGVYIRRAREVRSGQSVGQTPDSIEHIYRAEQVALLESLLSSADSLTGHARLVTLLARQLGEARKGLSPEEQKALDRQARTWLAELKGAGYRVRIPGVTR